MVDDENHEAHGAMIHRGIVEQRQYNADQRQSALEAENKRLTAELAAAKQLDVNRVLQLETAFALCETLESERDALRADLAEAQDAAELCCAGQDDLKKENDNLRAELATKAMQCCSLADSVGVYMGRVDDLRAELAAEEETSVDTWVRVKELEVDLEEARSELAVANEVIDRLVKTERKVADAIGDAYLLDLPDGGDVKLWEGAQRLRAELDKWIARASEDWPEAASKIERLTAELARLQECFTGQDYTYRNEVERRERAEAERDALRSAAKWLVEQADKCGFVDDHGHKLTMNKAFIDLRARLAKGSGNE